MYVCVCVCEGGTGEGRAGTWRSDYVSPHDITRSLTSSLESPSGIVSNISLGRHESSNSVGCAMSRPNKRCSSECSCPRVLESSWVGRMRDGELVSDAESYSLEGGDILLLMCARMYVPCAHVTAPQLAIAAASPRQLLLAARPPACFAIPVAWKLAPAKWKGSGREGW